MMLRLPQQTHNGLSLAPVLLALVWLSRHPQPYSAKVKMKMNACLLTLLEKNNLSHLLTSSHTRHHEIDVYERS